MINIIYFFSLQLGTQHFFSAAIAANRSPWNVAGFEYKTELSEFKTKNRSKKCNRATKVHKTKPNRREKTQNNTKTTMSTSDPNLKKNGINFIKHMTLTCLLDSCQRRSVPTSTRKIYFILYPHPEDFNTNINFRKVISLH